MGVVVVVHHTYIGRQFSDIQLGHDIASLVRMTDILKGLGGVLASLIDQDLLSTGMLRRKRQKRVSYTGCCVMAPGKKGLEERKKKSPIRLRNELSSAFSFSPMGFRKQRKVKQQQIVRAEGEENKKRRGVGPNLVDESCAVVDLSVDGDQEAVFGRVLGQLSEGVSLWGSHFDCE